MIFNSISNEYNKAQLTEHQRRLRLIQSQRVTYYPTSKPKELESNLLQNRKSSRQKYHLSNTFLGDLNQQVADQTQRHRQEFILKRKKLFDNRSSSSKQLSDLRSSKYSSHSREHQNQTKYTFNPSNQRNTHYVNRIRAFPKYNTYQQNKKSLGNWKVGKQIRFSYSNKPIIDYPPVKKSQKQEEEEGRYFQKNNYDFQPRYNQPIEKFKFEQNQKKQYKIKSNIMPQPDRIVEESDRFFDWQQSANQNKIVKNINSSQKNTKDTFSPLNLLNNEDQIKMNYNNKNDRGIIQKMVSKFGQIDNDGKIITLGIIGLGILLVIMQTIQ